MANSKSIPWRRIVAEGAAIVLSILLAFAIEAWWDGVLERRAEQQILLRLRSDFQAVRKEAARLKAGHQKVSDAALNLLALTGPRASPATNRARVDTLVASLVAGPGIFVPTQGTLSALLNTDGLRSVSDAELRSALSEWPRHVAVVQRTETQVQTLVLEHLMPYLYERVPVRTLDLISSPEVRGELSRFPLESHRLLSDIGFENLVNDRLYFATQAVIALQRADSLAAAILQLLEKRLR